MPVRFGEFTFDSAQRELLRNGTPVHLSRKAFDILALLMDRRPNVVQKRELLDVVWQGRAIEEENIKNLIAELRRALDDASSSPRFIRTVHGIGYAFCGDIPCTVSSWAVIWEERAIPIVSEVMIGRATRCEVRLHSKNASRQHARITLSPSGASLEDLGSTNGTFVNGTRIAGPTVLTSGDVISVGAETMTIIQADESTTAVSL